MRLEIKKEKYKNLIEAFSAKDIKNIPRDEGSTALKVKCQSCNSYMWKKLGDLRTKYKQGITTIYCNHKCFSKARIDKTNKIYEEHENIKSFICDPIKENIKNGKIKANDPGPRYLRGISAEHMVMSHCLNMGYPCFTTLPTLPYDLVLDYKDILVKIQVKSQIGPSSVSREGRKTPYPIYRFEIRSKGYKQTKKYTKNCYDIIALVAMDVGVVSYLHNSELTVKQLSLNSPNYKNKSKRKNMDYYTLDRALRICIKNKKAST